MANLIFFQGEIIPKESDANLRRGVGRDDCPHASQTLGLGGIDMLDPGMGMIAEFDFPVEHARALEVVNVMRFPCGLIRAFRPGCFFSDIVKICHCFSLSRAAAFFTASTIWT